MSGLPAVAQTQPTAVAPAAPAVSAAAAPAKADPKASLDADIAAALAELNGEPVVEGEAATEDGAIVEGVSDASSEDNPAKVERASDKIDLASLVEAIDTKDTAKLLAALGPAADDLLSGKAHAALRVQLKDANEAIKKAALAEKRADGIAEKLGAKYADPIAVRKAIDTGDKSAVDMFIDYAEKTAGTDWNTVMRWVAKGLAGRPERLAVKQQEAAKQVETQTAEQKQALEQTKAWVTEGINAKDVSLVKEAPELVDLVIDEIRTGYARGVDSPAKALPLVLKKLEAQHAKLAKLLAKTGKKPVVKEVTPSPASRVGTRPEQPRTRRTTLEEDIAATKREMGLR